MPEYNHTLIEQKWQQYWQANDVYRIAHDTKKPKYYVLSMFPYPSGAGLHIGHPLGYTAADVVARYKRLKGFQVLHPMGFDSFGLPAEQYAIDTGQHPAITTAENINNFKMQLAKLGFSYDWSRQVQTSDPDYYRWTQWIFMQLFNAWYNRDTDRAEPIKTLISCFETTGNVQVNAACDDEIAPFSDQEWKNFNQKKQRQILSVYRLTYLDDAVVNWCEALGSVLANDEVKDGYSERGGYPVECKKMTQWMMRITAYADRLQRNLEKIDWSDALKEMQRNWIGKSHGCELNFQVADLAITLSAFTTRPDTIFGVTYLVIAPEHELLAHLTTADKKEAVEAYINEAKNRAEKERMAEVKSVSGVFTGTYVINPITQEKIPLWVADYVLADYGTGVVMAVPSSDDRDYRFAKHFDLPIVRVIKETENLYDPTQIKSGEMINSGFLNGMDSNDAIYAVIEKAQAMGVGVAKVNYKMRDAVFSRQRYWGEPVPVYYREGIPYLIHQDELPLKLPSIDNYKPTATGKPPLSRAKNWKYQKKYDYEHTTMPGWAGSSWYFLRYMDANNSEAFADKKALAYWAEVDLYIGGTEHATGHLLYARFWNMFLYDMGLIDHEEPFKKLVNQGMIQGRSSLVYKVKDENKFVSHGLRKNHDTSPIHVPISFVKNDVLDIAAFKQWRPEYNEAVFVLEQSEYRCGHLIEKMSKNKYNTIDPNGIIKEYGADTLRLYEVFLGPLQQAKPWNTEGIEGVSRFLKKLWRLFYNKEGELIVNSQQANEKELKILHKTIKKVAQDIEKLSFNTPVSTLMVCVNELTALKCHKCNILKYLLIVLSPFAPHICEELWVKLGNTTTITKTDFPDWDEKYLKEDSHEYPISVNGKLRTKMSFSTDTPQEKMRARILADEKVQKWLQGKPAKKVIIVSKRIVNIVT